MTGAPRQCVAEGIETAPCPPCAQGREDQNPLTEDISQKGCCRMSLAEKKRSNAVLKALRRGSTIRQQVTGRGNPNSLAYGRTRSSPLEWSRFRYQHADAVGERGGSPALAQRPVSIDEVERVYFPLSLQRMSNPQSAFSSSGQGFVCGVRKPPSSSALPARLRSENQPLPHSEGTVGPLAGPMRKSNIK